MVALRIAYICEISLTENNRALISFCFARRKKILENLENLAKKTGMRNDWLILFDIGIQSIIQK